MARKKKSKPADTDIDHDMAVATVTLLQRAWVIASVHGVCPICMVYEAAHMVELAEEAGHIQHGLAELDEKAINANYVGTIQ